MLLRWLLILSLAASAMVARGVPAWAHDGAPSTAEPVAVNSLAEQVQPAPLTMTPLWCGMAESFALLWIAIPFAVAVLVAGRRGARRAFVLTIVLVLALFAFEGGVHSVHHLGDRQAGTTCAVASAVSHLAGVDVDGPAADCVAPPSFERLVVARPATPGLRPLAAHQGRAPPLAV